MNQFEEFFNNSDRPIHKWKHYFDIYEKYFNFLKGKKIKMLEIGIGKGGSLQMWKNYFGKESEIIGIDINPLCKKMEESQIKIEIGNQSDVNFLNEIISKYKNFDIIIDDGSHHNSDQIQTFSILFKILNEKGIYLVEDTHSSYWKKYNGGVNKNNTFTEYSKKIIDDVNAYQIQEKYDINYYANYVYGVYYHDSIIVFEKKFKDFTPYDLKSSKGKVTSGRIQKRKIQNDIN
jgi:23S rRNA U2552 (ribose-2'-O)-methylase RlmE/FtsJ